MLTDRPPPPSPWVYTLHGLRSPRHPAGRGQQAQAPAPGRRGVGAQGGDWGLGRGNWDGQGCWQEGSPRQRRHWCRCALGAAQRAPLSPEAQAHLRRRERKKPPLARISGSQSSFCPKHRDRTPLSAALASPLPIFGLFSEEPVPQPRVAAVVTRVSPAAGTLSPARDPPSRALFPPSPAAAALRPLPGRRGRVGLRAGCRDEGGDFVVKLNLTLWLPGSGREPGAAAARGPTGGGRAAMGARGRSEAVPPPRVPTLRPARAPPAPQAAGLLRGAGSAARYARPPGRARRCARSGGRASPLRLEALGRLLHVEGCVWGRFVFLPGGGDWLGRRGTEGGGNLGPIWCCDCCLGRVLKLEAPVMGNIWGAVEASGYLYLVLSSPQSSLFWPKVSWSVQIKEAS